VTSEFADGNSSTESSCNESSQKYTTEISSVVNLEKEKIMTGTVVLAVVVGVVFAMLADYFCNCFLTYQQRTKVLAFGVQVVYVLLAWFFLKNTSARILIDTKIHTTIWVIIVGAASMSFHWLVLYLRNRFKR
jgi:uncharacterized membrane-anchored protein